MATDIEQCKHDPRTEEKMNFLVVRQDIGKVLLCVFCGRDESAYRNEGAQFCVVMTNSKRNKHNPRTEEKINFLVVRQDIGKVLLRL